MSWERERIGLSKSVYWDCLKTVSNKMRKVLFVALVALCAAFQGEVCAENSMVQELSTVTFTGNRIGEVQLEWIFNQVVDQTGMTYSEVRSLYEQGKMDIDKVEEGYLVTLEIQTEGGLTDILIGSGF